MFSNDVIDILNELYNNILLIEEAPKTMNLGIITLIYKNKGKIEEL